MFCISRLRSEIEIMAVDSTSGAVELLKKKSASDLPGGYGYLLVFVDPSSRRYTLVLGMHF